jgi:hypothetical protein
MTIETERTALAAGHEYIRAKRLKDHHFEWLAVWKTYAAAGGQLGWEDFCKLDRAVRYPPKNKV